jgi:hypothetical protein
MPFLPQSAAAGSNQRGHWIQGIRGGQDATPKRRTKFAQPSHDPVVKTVNGASIRQGGAVNSGQQCRITGLWQGLELDPDLANPAGGTQHRVQGFVERRDRFTVRKPDRTKLLERSVCDGSETVDGRIMVNDELARPARVNVELDAVGSEPDGRPEGGKGVLDLRAGGTPMGNDFDKSPYL